MEEEREEEEIRMVDGNLIIPRRYLNDLESLQREIRNKPTILDYLLHEDTRLANAILSEETVLLAEFLFGKQDEERNSTDIEKKKTKTIAKTKYEARVRNPELRRENIRRSRIFVDVLVNGKTVKALVDTGAELSIVTSKLIEECELDEYVDKSYKGTVVGMGSQKITGRIHCMNVKLKNSTFPISLICVNHQMSSPFLIGLNFLWRHGAIINLREETLRIGLEMIELNVDRVRVTETLEGDEQHVCKLCSRKFKTREKLLMHKNKSKMHRENVARMHDTEKIHDERSTKEESDEEKNDEDERSTKECEGNDFNEDTISRVLQYLLESRAITQTHTMVDHET